MDASDSQVRAWAQEHDVAVSSRGRVSESVREAYNAAHNGTATPGPDYPDGMDETDFGTAEAETPDDGDDYLAETPPRAPAPKAGPRSAAKSLRDRWKRGSKPAPKKRRAPRTSTADLIGSGWRIGAKLLQPLPPLYRVARLQSEIAGPLLDQQVAGTFIDPALQVLARHYEAGETIGALVGPHLGIGAAILHQSQCAQRGVDPNPIVMQACIEVTRAGLKSMLKLGGDAMAARIAEEKEDQERYGVTVDVLLGWIMSPPEDAATEEANMARMANVFAGQPDAEPDAEPDAA